MLVLLTPYFEIDKRNSHVLPRRVCLAVDAALGSGEAAGETTCETRDSWAGVRRRPAMVHERLDG
jgi:hypothetical protein